MIPHIKTLYYRMRASYLYWKLHRTDEQIASLLQSNRRTEDIFHDTMLELTLLNLRKKQACLHKKQDHTILELILLNLRKIQGRSAYRPNVPRDLWGQSRAASGTENVDTSLH